MSGLAANAKDQKRKGENFASANETSGAHRCGRNRREGPMESGVMRSGCVAETICQYPRYHSKAPNTQPYLLLLGLLLLGLLLGLLRGLLSLLHLLGASDQRVEGLL